MATLKTAALLIDGNNVSRGLDNRRLDVVKLLERLKEEGYDIKRAHYFLAVRAVMEEDAFDRHRTFVNMLVAKDYQVHEKQMRRSGAAGGWKGDCDMEIALEAADAVREQEWLLLMTNDSDFHALIEYVHYKAKKIAIVSIDGGAAVELRNDADRYIDLSEIEDIFFTPTRNGEKV